MVAHRTVDARVAGSSPASTVSRAAKDITYLGRSTAIGEVGELQPLPDSRQFSLWAIR